MVASKPQVFVVTEGRKVSFVPLRTAEIQRQGPRYLERQLEAEKQRLRRR